MEKISKVKYVESRSPDGKNSNFPFLVANEDFVRSVRTKSGETWAREAYLDKDDEKDILHFISFDSSTTSYLLESVVRVGKGYRREEVSMSVADIKSSLGGDPESTEEIVTLLAQSLAEVAEGFNERPPCDHEHCNPPMAEDDPLRKGRGAEGLSEEKRAVIRKLLASDPIEKKDLPEGILSLTKP